MGKPEKTFDTWAKTVPVEAHIGDVMALLNFYFDGEWRWGDGSHIVVTSDRLKEYQEYQPYGELCIPTLSGKRVKGFYIKRLVKAIKILQEQE